MLINYLTFDFPDGQRDDVSFTSDKEIEANQELIDAAKEYSDRVSSGEKCIVGLWEDAQHLLIKKFLPVNQDSGFSDAHHEYFAALIWKQVSGEHCEFILKQVPEYNPNDHETAPLYKEAAAKETGYTRALEYLREAEDRLLEEAHNQIKKLPNYAAQAAAMEMLFEKAKTDKSIRGKMIETAAKTKN
jgi:hypothetical protein